MMVEWGSSLFPDGWEIVMDVTVDFFFFNNFLISGFRNRTSSSFSASKGSVRVGILSYSLQVSRNIVSAMQFFFNCGSYYSF